MATFFTIVVTPNPVTVTTSNPTGLSYQQLIQTLIYTAYRVNEIYYKAQGIEQLNQVFNLYQTTPQGNTKTKIFIPIVDPEQSNAVLDLNIVKNELNINNLTSLAFTLLPNEIVELKMTVDASSFQYLLGPQIQLPGEKWYFDGNQLKIGETPIKNEVPEQTYTSLENNDIAFKLCALFLSIILIYAGTKDDTN